MSFSHPHPAEKEHIVIVAFSIYADTHEQAQHVITDQIPYQELIMLSDGAITSWWVAHDNRIDGSDNSSAVFIPGDKLTTLTEDDAYHVLNTHIEYRREIEADGGESGLLQM